MDLYAGEAVRVHLWGLKKGSGSRRIWVAECTERVSLKLLERDRDQLWAEAVAMLTKEMRS